jgi:hypothetical protein
MSNVTLFQFIDKSFIFYKSKTQFIYFLLSKQKNQEILIPISTKFQTRLPHIYIYIRVARCKTQKSGIQILKSGKFRNFSLKSRKKIRKDFLESV